MRENYKDNLCGIDEAGRGPFAGPLVVAGVVFKNEFYKNIKLDDSKKLTDKKRENLFDTIKENSFNHIVFKSNKEIDKFGLSLCLKESLQEIMKNIKAKQYLMDGNTTFGVENLSFLVKADAKINEVSAASILAKVTRDRYMIKMALLYPQYSFEKHKGYGTKIHTEAIIKYGFCEIHRRTFKIKKIESLKT